MIQKNNCESIHKGNSMRELLIQDIIQRIREVNAELSDTSRWRATRVIELELIKQSLHSDLQKLRAA